VAAGFRCRPASDFSSAKVSNIDGAAPIERQLYGASTAKNFLLPVSTRYRPKT